MVVKEGVWRRNQRPLGNGKETLKQRLDTLRQAIVTDGLKARVRYRIATHRCTSSVGNHQEWFLFYAQQAIVNVLRTLFHLWSYPGSERVMACRPVRVAEPWLHSRHTPRGPGPKSVRQGADRAQSGLLSRVYENAELLFRDRVLGDVRRIDRERRQQRLRACAPCSLASLVPQARAVLPKTICRQVGLTDKSLTILPELPSCRPSAKKNACESAAGARISTQTARPR